MADPVPAPPAGQGEAGAASSVALSPRRSTAAVVLAALLACALLATSDPTRDAASAAAAVAARLPWSAVLLAAAVLTLAAAHYVLAALALRAASGADRPLREITGGQLAAAAANRLVPGGVGAAAVNLRYLLRAGLSPGSALSTLGVLGVVGGASDALVAGGITGLGPHVGVRGAAHEIGLLAGHGLRAGRSIPWPVTAGVALLLVGVFVWRQRRRGGPRAGEVGRHVGRHLRQLAARPGRLATAATASGGTTAALALGFALTVHAVAGPAHGPPLGALLAAYLVASAVGGAAPVPAVFGVTETVLVAALVATGLPLRAALVSTLAFRLVAFWAPVPLGALAARRLRRRQLL